jgi:hypothetical protein
MQTWLSFLDVARTLVLPLGIAVIGALTTITLSSAQLRSRDRERVQDRADRELERYRSADASEFQVRAEVIEGIAESFAQYAEQAASSLTGRASTFRVRSALLRLTTRCDTGHLSSDCVGYVLDTLQIPDPGRMFDTFADIQRHLEGWHLGHLTLHELTEYVNDGRRHARDHLALHEIAPEQSFVDDIHRDHTPSAEAD